ncbi:SCO7613 C-terminal domain-containing membrane protein [Leifsonia sp. NPDC058230]|uniref:SCO7613 C-terminal domain-containing membrane protein n=1 Tax=Leifsonia sp. NPDC058230 TaxID=3346391 RepID=UPI0036DB853E
MTTESDEGAFAHPAQRIDWPSGPGYLTDATLCPACFSPLTGIDCPVCGLRLAGETSAQLLETSQVAARAMGRRAELIGRLRFEKEESARATAARAAAVQAGEAAWLAGIADVPAQPPMPAPVRRTPVVTVPTTPPTPPAAGPAQDAHPRRRSSVQLLLLATGVVLVSVAAVFFLIVAFIANGLIFRSVVIGLLTALAIALASWLRPRLPATAEGIGALAVAFVYLDVWLVRANDLFGAGGGSVTVYWGTTLLSASLLFVIWFRVSRLRVASVAAFSTLPIGAGLLAAGLTADTAPFLDLYAGFLGAAIAAVAWMFADDLGTRMRYPTPLAAERFILLGIGTIAAVGAALSAIFAVPDAEWAPAVTLGALVIVGLAHGIPLARRADSALLRGFGVAVCGAVAVLPAAAAAMVCVRADAPVAALWWPLLLGTVAAVGCDVLARRASVWARSAAAGAAVGAGLSAAIALVAVTVVAAQPLVRILSARRAAWTSDPFTALTVPSAESIAAVLALAMAVVVAAVVWFAARTLRGPRAVGLAWVAVAGVVVGVAFLAAPLVIVVASLVVTAAGLWALERFAGAGVPLRAPLRTAAILLPALAYVVSYAELWSWALASVGVIGVILAFRRSSVPEARMLLLLTGEVFALVTVALAPIAVHLAFPASVGTVDSGVEGVAEWVAAAAAALALVFAVPARRFVSDLERSFGFLIAAVAGVGAFAWQLVFRPPVPGTGIELPDVVAFAAGVLAVAAIATWLTASGNRTVIVGRTAAAVLAAVTLWVAIVEAVRILMLIGITIDPVLAAVVPGAVVLLIAAAGFVSALLNVDIGRGWTDAGAALLLVGASVAASAANLPLVLVFGALAALVAAIDVDGLLASASWRRHLGWLSLALGLAALWVQLGRSDVSALEPYVLPLSAALLVVAVLLWSFRPSTARYRLGVAALVLAGLTASLVPLALADPGVTVRSVVVGIVSALLVVGALFVPLGARAVAERTAAALAGAVGIIATVARHADSPGVDVWLAAGFAVLAIGAWGLARLARDARLPQLGQAAVAALAVDVGFSGLVSLVTIAPGGEVRALVLVTIATTVAVLGFTVRTLPLSPVVGWTGYAVAALVAICSLTIGRVDPFELVTVPLALGMLVHGWFRMRRSDVRSWPALGPGLAVLLIPPLLADYGPTELWRAVALGVVALGVLIAGLVLRWQAPFVFGSVVLLWHAVAQLWPWISALYEAVPWWLWLGIGGAILIALAARYERRIQNARSLVASISALR